MVSQTMFDKIWDLHVISDLGGDMALLHADRILVHDLSGARALGALLEEGGEVRNPELCFAAPDHTVTTDPTTGGVGDFHDSCVRPLQNLTEQGNIHHFGLGDKGFGILHVIGPEQGITLPGTTVVCGDSHTCTHGGMGALAWGIGASELVHALATQTVMQRKPKRMRVNFDGHLPEWLSAKDLILHVIGREGAAAGDGYAVEYAGASIRALGVEARLTLCNLSIEMGAKVGMIAPDDTIYHYLCGRPYAPAGGNWDRALTAWRALTSDDEATFDAEINVPIDDLAPHISWGTSPEHTIAVTDRIPDPADEADLERRHALRAAQEYIGLDPGALIEGTPVDWVFIGSCTNSRLSDFVEAARVLEGRKIAEGVRAWAVPGSASVKAEVEAAGLHGVLKAAGVEWRLPGCSLCVGANGETVPAGQRCVSTSNRNFVGRQGKDSRTHLASPAMAAAAAVTGQITDVRKLMR